MILKKPNCNTIFIHQVPDSLLLIPEYSADLHHRVSTVSESQWKNGFLEKSQWKSVKVSESQWIALVGQWKVSEKDFWHNWFLLLLLLDISSDPSFCGFPALELKIFLNLGDNLSWKSMEILHSWAFQSSRIQNFFNHGKSILSEKNAWNSFILEHFRAAEFKISFNQGENILCDINENPSFWSISEQQNSKFPSTMVKISSVVFTKSLHSGAFHIPSYCKSQPSLPGWNSVCCFIPKMGCCTSPLRSLQDGLRVGLCYRRIFDNEK